MSNRIMWRKLEPGEIAEVGDIIVKHEWGSDFDMNFNHEELMAYHTLRRTMPQLEPAVGIIGSPVLRSEAVWRIIRTELPEPTSPPISEERRITHEL